MTPQTVLIVDDDPRYEPLRNVLQDEGFTLEADGGRSVGRVANVDS
jgi:hypothetical protein